MKLEFPKTLYFASSTSLLGGSWDLVTVTSTVLEVMGLNKYNYPIAHIP